jgi:hypothetical protein
MTFITQKPRQRTIDDRPSAERIAAGRLQTNEGELSQMKPKIFSTFLQIRPEPMEEEGASTSRRRKIGMCRSISLQNGFQPLL